MVRPHLRALCSMDARYIFPTDLDQSYTTMKNCVIRSACSDDAEAIADALLDSRREAMPWLPVLHSREETIAYFAGHVLVYEEVLVAEVNELVVGFMALEGDHIDHLYIAPSCQGRGIGDKLLTTAKELRPGGLTL